MATQKLDTVMVEDLDLSMKGWRLTAYEGEGCLLAICMDLEFGGICSIFCPGDECQLPVGLTLISTLIYGTQYD
jgi:hypothetical protein